MISGAWAKRVRRLCTSAMKKTSVEEADETGPSCPAEEARSIKRGDGASPDVEGETTADAGGPRGFLLPVAKTALSETKGASSLLEATESSRGAGRVASGAGAEGTEGCGTASGAALSSSAANAAIRSGNELAGAPPRPTSPVTASTCAEASGEEASPAAAPKAASSPADTETATDGRGASSAATCTEPGAAPTCPGFEPDEGWEAEDNIEGRAEQLRHFFSPLSREQLLDLLSVAALKDRNLYELCAERVHSSPSSRRLMVRNIHFNTSDQRFSAFFESFGPLDDALIVKERSGHSKGYGFVTFSTSDGVKNCLLASPLFLDGRQLHVKLAADPFVSRDQTKLFVRNLSDQTTTDSLRAVFSQFGHLKECVVVRDSTGRSRGYGFLNFATPLEAFKAVQQTERIIDGRVAFIHFAASTTSRSGGNNRSHHAHSAVGGGGISGGLAVPHLGGGGHLSSQQHSPSPDGAASGSTATHRGSALSPPASHRGGLAPGAAGGMPGLGAPRPWSGGISPDSSRFGPKRRGNNPNGRADGGVSGVGGDGLRGAGGGAKGYRNLDRLVYGDTMGYGDVFRYSMGPHFSPALYPPGADLKGAISPAFALGFTTYPIPPYYVSQDGLASLNTSL